MGHMVADPYHQSGPESRKKAGIGALGDRRLFQTISGIQVLPVTSARKYAQIPLSDPLDYNQRQENSGMGARAEVDTLTQQHASLDAVITEESQRPNPDFIKISEMKREKLRLKEQIELTHRH